MTLKNSGPKAKDSSSFSDLENSFANSQTQASEETQKNSLRVKEDEVVMCTVVSIEGTTVFVDIEGHGPGSIAMSEVAAGRIRNLREYVLPKKKIACKVLHVASGGHVELSLRRVTGKEREEMKERYKKERTLVQIMKSITPTPSTIIEEIKKKYDLSEFFSEVNKDPSILEKFMKKEDALKLAALMEEKEGREKEVKKLFTLKTHSESGLRDLKEILSLPDASANADMENSLNSQNSPDRHFGTKDKETNQNVCIRYLGSSQFSITAKAVEFKDANNKVESALEQIAKKAKERKAAFELKEK